jgi:UDP-N-acetylmuramate: L-alanyl-gamma-D-glutamyl-meso-diaminopimelate ligase
MKEIKIHFIGICGAGMSAVAKLCRDSGAVVSGSDAGFYPPISTYLEKNNIPCISGYRAENIPKDADYIVIGKHAKLVPEECEEVREACEKYPERVRSFPQILHQITENRKNILCVGSFGKSTTTALMAHILEAAEKDPGYFIGASPVTPATNAHIGTSEYFVLEGDEYPSANFDATSKFLHLDAESVLLTSLEHDHVNIFKTHADYKKPFFELIEKLAETKDSTLVLCPEDQSIQNELPYIHNIYPRFISYGLSQGDYYASNISYGQTTRFDLMYKGSLVTSLSTALLGTHNIQNIVGVSALLLEKNLVTPAELATGIASFVGITRRLDLLTPDKKTLVYEGFGSSYAKARAAIEALLLHYPEKHLVILFEPHTFSWRNLNALAWYDTVFSEARLVFVYQPPSHGANTHKQLSQSEIIERIQGGACEQEVVALHAGAHDVPEIISRIQNDDIVLILSSGDMDGIIAELPKRVI